MKKRACFKLLALTIVMLFGLPRMMNAQTEPKNYQLVTSTSQLTAGKKYLIIGTQNETTAVLSRQNTNNRLAIPITISDNAINTLYATSASDDLPFELTLGGTADNWTLFDEINNIYIGPDRGNTSNNHLKGSSGIPTWTIAINETTSAAAITCFGSESNTSRNIIRYNNASNLFACYASGQNDVFLYQAVTEEPIPCALSQDIEHTAWGGTGSAGYANRTITDDLGNWSVSAITTMAAGDRFHGTRSARFRGNTSDTGGSLNKIEMLFDNPNGIGTVSFVYGSFGTHSGGIINLEYSTNQGVSWTTVESVTVPSWTAAGEVMQKASFDVNVPENARIRITKNPQSGSTSVNIDDICITDFGGVLSRVSPPTFNLPAATYYSPQTINITSATEDVVIRYTLDNTDPNESSPEFLTPFQISATTTIKAKAWKDGMEPSNISTITYTFPIEVENIAAFLALNSATNTTLYHITGDLTFAFRDRRNIYVQDETGGLLIYDNATSIITTVYTEGDVIPGMYGTYTLFNGVSQIIPHTNTEPATSNTGEINSVIATVAQILENYKQFESKLVKIEGVTFAEGNFTATASNINITQAGSTMQCRNHFGTVLMAIEENYLANVTGFVLRNNNNFQIAPRSNNDITEFIPESAYVVVSPTNVAFGNAFVNTTNSRTITVTGTDLEGDLTVSIDGEGFNCVTTTISAEAVMADGGVEITVTFRPTTTTLYTGTLTISGGGLATPVNVALTGTGVTNYNIFEDFEQVINGTALYAGSYVTFASGEYFIAGTATMDANDRYIDTRSIRLRGNNAADTGSRTNRIEMNFDKPNGAGMVSFKYASYSSHSGGIVYVQYSTDQGETWNDVPNNSVTAPAWNAEVGMLDANVAVDISGDVRVRIIKPRGGTTNSVNIDNLEITDYDPENMVTTPVFSVPSGILYEPTEIFITSATQEATIRYTTDGSDPIETSTELLEGESVLVNSTQTLKAKAWKDGMVESGISTATYTFPIEVENIAEFIAANSVTNSTPYHITGDLTFVFRNEVNMYVQDETGGLLIYDNGDIITEEYEEGDIIQGIYGTYTLYRGLSEMIPLKNTETAEENTGEVAPLVATVAEIIDDYQTYESKLVRINGVVFTQTHTFTTASATNADFTQEDDDMQCRNTFKTLAVTLYEDMEADIIGFVSKFDNIFQISPRGNEDIIVNSAQVATPTFSPNGGTHVGSVIVTIECETEDALIYYTTNGDEPTETSTLYTEPFTLTATTTLKAKAFKDNIFPSVVATATFDISSGILTTIHQGVKIYPVPVQDRLIVESENFNSEKIEIFSMNGQVLYSLANPQTKESVDVQHLSAGIYFVRISSGRDIIVKKFVKQ